MGRILIWLFFLAAVSSLVFAEELPTAPSHKFWDKPNIMLFALDSTAKTADFVATHHNLSHGGVEFNPLARPLCNKGTAGQSVFFFGQSAAAIGVSYLLHKSGHHRLERMFTLVNIVDSTYGATYSFAHR